MTATNFMVFPDGVAIFADTAAYSPAGVIEGFRSKIVVDERNRWAMTFTGSRATAERVEAALGEVDFDGACAALLDVLRAAVAQGRSVAGDFAELDVIVAGYSATRGEWAGVIVKSSLAKVDATLPVFEPIPAGGSIAPHVFLDGVTKPFPEGEIERNAQALGVAEFARRVMQAQRQAENKAAHGGHVVVGGVGELVIMTAAGVRREITNRWLDSIGDTVERVRDRARAELPVEFLPALSRAERRRMARVA